MEQENLISYGILLFLCIVIGLICIGKKKKRIWISLGIQGMIGVLSLIGMTELMPYLGYERWVIEIGPKSLICSGILGIPGVAMMYGITVFYHIKVR